MARHGTEGSLPRVTLLNMDQGTYVNKVAICPPQNDYLNFLPSIPQFATLVYVMSKILMLVCEDGKKKKKEKVYRTTEVEVGKDMSDHSVYFPSKARFFPGVLLQHFFRLV